MICLAEKSSLPISPIRECKKRKLLAGETKFNLLSHWTQEKDPFRLYKNNNKDYSKKKYIIKKNKGYFLFCGFYIDNVVYLACMPFAFF